MLFSCVRLHYGWNLPTYTKDLGSSITFLARFWVAAASDLAETVPGAATPAAAAAAADIIKCESESESKSKAGNFIECLGVRGIHLGWFWLHKFGAVCDRDAVPFASSKSACSGADWSGVEWIKCGSAVALPLGIWVRLWTSPYVITITATSTSIATATATATATASKQTTRSE